MLVGSQGAPHTTHRTRIRPLRIRPLASDRTPPLNGPLLICVTVRAASPRMAVRLRPVTLLATTRPPRAQALGCSLCLSLTRGVPPPPPLSLSLTHTHSLTLSLSLFLARCLSLPLFLAASLPLSLSLSLLSIYYLSLSFLLAASLPLSLSLPCALCKALALCVSWTRHEPPPTSPLIDPTLKPPTAAAQHTPLSDQSAFDQAPTDQTPSDRTPSDSSPPLIGLPLIRPLLIRPATQQIRLLLHPNQALTITSARCLPLSLSPSLPLSHSLSLSLSLSLPLSLSV